MKNKLSKIFILGAVMGAVSLPTFAHEIGLQLYSLRNQMKEDLPQAIKQVSDWGIRNVEAGGALYGFSVNEFKAELEKNNLALVSADTSYDEVNTNPMGAVYKAKYYGAKYATFYWIPHNGKTGFTIDKAQEAVAVLNKAGKLMQAHGITLQYHPHGYEFQKFEDGTVLDYMLKNVTEAKFQMDVFWMKQGGMDPLALLQKYPGKFTSLHLKDRLIGSPNSSNGAADVETQVVLGSGDVGIAGVVAEAKKQGIRYFFIEDESSRVLQQVPKSLHYLHQLDGRH
ncbi:MAG: sugar phosphate isomerase/epimerase family protein [Thalassotalea sp.]